jgi:pyruvate dehydrogenase E2 component (dihydrolipoamide acetyltransferase)
MATEITMPKLSDTMTEGRFGSWRKSVGDRVERGEIIAEVETDKAVMELEAFSSGILLEQRATTGDLIPVGTVIGLVGLPGEETLMRPGPTDLPPQLVLNGIGPERIMDEESLVPSELPPVVAQHGEQAGPVVRRRAREMGIDLSLVDGSGPGGRILLEDLERFSGVSIGTVDVPVREAQINAASAPPTSTAADNTALIHRGSLPTEESVPLTKMRTAIARTVSEAWRSIPHFSLSLEVAMDAAVEVRRELKLGGSSISLNDLVIKAAAMALVKYPQLNSTFVGDGLILHREINIGIAVALPDGLLVPVLRGCDGLSLKEISVRTPPLVTRARNSQLAATELLGATFTISNLGMFGIDAFAAVIHPGQAAILAIGALRECVVVKGGLPAIGQQLNLTLSADHRVIDGAYAAAFLSELKAILETPIRMLV